MSNSGAPHMSTTKRFTMPRAPVANTKHMTAVGAGPVSSRISGLIEKMAHYDREVIQERRMNAKGGGVIGTSRTHGDITRYTRPRFSRRSGSRPAHVRRFSNVSRRARRGRCGTRHRARPQVHTWGATGHRRQQTPGFFFRDPRRFSDLNHASSATRAQGCAARTNNGILVAAAGGGAPGHDRHVRSRTLRRVSEHALSAAILYR